MDLRADSRDDKQENQQKLGPTSPKKKRTQIIRIRNKPKTMDMKEIQNIDGNTLTPCTPLIWKI